MARYQAYRIGTHEPVNPGDAVTDFRGEPGVLLAATRADRLGSSGKVSVIKDAITCHHNSNVWGLEVREVAVPHRCEQYARKGTGSGTCDEPLDAHGQCARASEHLDV